MKKNVSRILSMMMAFAVAFSLIIIPQTAAVHADDFGVKVEYTTKTATLATGNYYVDFGKKFNENKDKIRVKSSNKSVAAVEKDYPTFELKKPGKATLTFVVTKKSGSKKTYKMTIKAVKYQNPFKSVKIGSKEYRSKFKKDVFYELEKGSGKYKVAITPAKGWKVESIIHAWYRTDKNGELDYNNLVEKKVKNKSKISITKGKSISWVSIVMYNKKTGCKEMIEFTFYNIDVDF